MNFSEQIKKIRTDNGLTQEQLAARLNVSRQTVSSWENNRNLPDLEMVVAIARQFGLSLDQLILGGNDTMAEKLIKDGSETRKARINMIMTITGAVLLCLGAACILLKGASVEYIDSAGFLHENFFLLPIGFLFIFSGLLTFLAVGFKSLITRLRRKSNQM